MMRRLVLFVVLGLVAASCAGATTETSTTSTSSTSTTIADAGGLPTEMASLIAATEEVRGLRFLEDPTVSIVSHDELAGRVRDLIDEDLDEEEVAAWETIYRLLGLLGPEHDLAEIFVEAHAASVVGFYDPDTKELVVGTDGALTPYSRTIVVHELVHALTDQHFGFWQHVEDRGEAGDHDGVAAIQALFEGDATYFMTVYLQSQSIADQIAFAEEALSVDTSYTDSLPTWFVEDITFPYDAGFRFVSRLVDTGGIDAVDEAYRLLPATTEQIMDPDRYFHREPARPVSMPDVELAGYEVFDEGTFGAWEVESKLLEGLAPSDLAIAVAGWGGDAYRIYWDGPNVVFAVLIEADTPNDAVELAEGIVAASAERMGLGPGRSGGEDIVVFDSGPGYGHVHQGERHVLFVVASEASAGSTVAVGLSTAVDP